MIDARVLFQGSSPLILDGGLATELERRGHDLRDNLWSARLLLENPSSILDVHKSYVDAGAQCLITASYQATIEGFVAKGISDPGARDLLRSSIRIARQAAQMRPSVPGVDLPWVAASIGPYGAALANGAEFHGNYGISKSALREFHAPRIEILADEEPDLFACETIPSLEEAEALLPLLEKVARNGAWVTFACKDEGHTCHGEPIEECSALLDSAPGVVAMGVNCTHPRFVSGLIQRIRGSTNKPIVVYPNSGQSWDALGRRWVGTTDSSEFVEWARHWHRLGASAIGGCCQTGPEHIRALSAAFRSS